jgi:hypothetical protein
VSHQGFRRTNENAADLKAGEFTKNDDPSIVEPEEKARPMRRPILALPQMLPLDRPRRQQVVSSDTSHTK